MKILIVKCSALGDIIHSYPVVDYLHKKIAPACIDWAVDARCQELVESHPKIERTIIFSFKPFSLKQFFLSAKQLRETEYDLVIDLQGNCKSGLITLLAKGKEKIGFCYESVAEWPNILATKRRFSPPIGQNIRQDYLSIVKQFFQDNSPFENESVRLKAQPSTIDLRNKIVVAPGSRWSNKCLPEQDLKDFLHPFSSPLAFLWGSAQEKEICLRLKEALGGELLPRLSLAQLQNALGEAELLIGMDSLPLHLAASIGTPTLSFFGPSSKEKYAPVGTLHQAYQGQCPYGVEFDKRCPRLRSCPTGACMSMRPTTLKTNPTKI